VIARHTEISAERARFHTAERDRSATDAGGLQYVLIMPVWGDHHTGLFLRYCIPFLLTQGNIGAFPDKRLQVHVASRRVDFVRMRQHTAYMRLSELASLSEVEIDDVIDVTTPHRAMTQCYLHVVRTLSCPERVVTIFPTPDCILSRNALCRIKQRIEAGFRAVMLCGLRLELETVRPLLDQIMASDVSLNSLDERTLTTLALQHLHPISLRCDVSSSEFWIGWPSHLYWIAPDRGWLLAHCFHLHPMAVRGVPRTIDVESTIDGDYLLALGIGPAECYICKNSDELLCLELSSGSKRINTRKGRLTSRHLSRFLAIGSNPLHHAFFANPILFCGNDEPAPSTDMTRQIKHFIGTVQRGPGFFYTLQGTVFSLIRATPSLRRLARLVLRGGRLAKRHVRYLFQPERT
jgi:hypothetical protein